MKKYIWKITANSSAGLKPLYIDADCLDEALALARTIDKRYNGGQVHSRKFTKY